MDLTQQRITIGYQAVNGTIGAVEQALVLYLAATGLDTGRIGLLLTLTLAGDAAISLWLTTSADRVGRRRTLIVTFTPWFHQSSPVCPFSFR